MKYGFVLTTYNDADDAVESIQSLKETIPPNSDYEIVIVDAGSKSEEISKLRAINAKCLMFPYQHLSEALNAGIDFLLKRNIDYVFWIHTDCYYFQPNWSEKLIQIYQHCWPLVARLAPGTSNIDGSYDCLQRNELLHHSNNCPWVMSKEFLESHKAKYGYYYNPDYINIGGCEDHDMWFRILQDGMFVCVTPLVDVWHKGMGSRSLRDTNSDQLYNREVFHKHWNHDIFPKIDFPLTDFHNSLFEEFNHLKFEVLSLHSKRDEYTRKWNAKRGIQ